MWWQPLIPYLEPAGNYNIYSVSVNLLTLIPYLEPAGNYNIKHYLAIQ